MKKRMEERKNVWITFLGALLLLALPAAAIRLTIAAEYLSGDDIQRAAGVYGTITDRTGQALMEKGTIAEPELYGNLISRKGGSDNSLYVRYGKEFLPDFSLFHGIHLYDDDSEDGVTEGNVLRTTLLSSAFQRQIADAFEGNDGCCFSYNYVTGEIYTALSLPSAAYDSGNLKSGTLVNQCFGGRYVPGSTMKIIASLLAAKQDKDILGLVHTCTGSLQLPDGTIVYCAGIHGTVDFAGALGHSCNCYFARIIQQLDPAETAETLSDMGFSVNTETRGYREVGKLSRTDSSVQFRNNASFQDVWGLIGQGDSLVNVMDMCRIAGAAANNGEAAIPYLVEEITDSRSGEVISRADSGKTERLFSGKTAGYVRENWQSAYQTYYICRGYPETVSYAKTGTAEVTIDGRDTHNSLLMGVIEERNTAFFIVVEDTMDSSAALRIARALGNAVYTLQTGD
ncbi:MAG: hypothetical protein IKU40_04505 [Clostridia bacterium]|nr:hypothetical protein [Clostridia bacterium]